GLAPEVVPAVLPPASSPYEAVAVEAVEPILSQAPIVGIEDERTLPEFPILEALAIQAYDPLASPSYTANWASTLPSPALSLAPIDKSVPVQYHLNLFMTPAEASQVITPPGQHNNVAIIGKDRVTFNSSAGFLLDVSKGRDGLQIGAVYSVHDYKPADLTSDNCLVRGDCPEGYSRFQYRTLSFPFAYERTLFKGRNWRVSANVGMAMTVFTEIDISITEEAQSGLNATLDDPRANRFTNPSNGRTNTISRAELTGGDEEFHGWFENGGGLLDNSRFYMGGGFSVERRINSRFSIYLAPNYSRMFSRENGGVGPYKDRIHRASLRFGSRYLLGEKK
ncbi:MAG: hypothetical protein AAF597_13925, partial [Bacteroidota bacterium]